MKKFDESMVGKKVRFISEESHEDAPEFYPPVGTIGEVMNETSYDYRIKWPKDSGVDKGYEDGKEYSWYCLKSKVEPVKDSVNHMTDAEVFKMLEPKLEKNGLNPKAYFVAENHRNEVLYPPEDFEKAVALIYRIGYGRGQKGRPFEYQNVKAELKKEEDKLVGKKDSLIGKKVVLTNPDEDSLRNGWAKGKIGKITRVYSGSRCVEVTFSEYNGETAFELNDYVEKDVFYKSELMLIVDDKPKKGDKVVFLDEIWAEADPIFYPPVGTVLNYSGMPYSNDQVKKVVPLC